MTQEPAIHIHDVYKSTTVIHRQDPTLAVSGDSARLKRIVEKASVTKSELSGFVDDDYCPRSIRYLYVYKTSEFQFYELEPMSW